MKLPPQIRVRLSTKNFIKTPFSEAIKSIDYSIKLKLLEIEFKEENGNDKVYHYLGVERRIFENILHLKKTIDSLPTPLPKKLREIYSLGRFVNQQVKPQYDYYELIV